MTIKQVVCAPFAVISFVVLFFCLAWRNMAGKTMFPGEEDVVVPQQPGRLRRILSKLAEEWKSSPS